MIDLMVLLFIKAYMFDQHDYNLVWCEHTPDWFVIDIILNDNRDISYFEYKQAEGYLYSQGIISMWTHQYSMTKMC